MRTSAHEAEAAEYGFTVDDVRALHSAMPQAYAHDSLSIYPVEVLRAWLLWQGVPASISFTHDDDGNCIGFSWDIDYAWRAKDEANEERFHAFFTYQDECKLLWEWFSAHPDNKISWQNLLHLWR